MHHVAIMLDSDNGVRDRPVTTNYKFTVMIMQPNTIKAIAIFAIAFGIALCVWLAMSVRIVILPMEEIDTHKKTLYVVVYRANVADSPKVSAICFNEDHCERLAGGFETIIGGRYECAALTI